ncbi:broad-complex core protein isoforms 1/2/3/4/5-like isoform X2 [Condylostylus longicornis]|uniref:broad-complex core protein isoforms 1/2/3/4/5-like isoform X2 n=1 Tax=Condylostylus longicornis TaxID=2530218 RepID=UPI00244DA9A7|nr:broad-complex core protein isoforms 1/2/3/4/5-like isoform X2 [Condylostylus longicornis]
MIKSYLYVIILFKYKLFKIRDNNKLFCLNNFLLLNMAVRSHQYFSLRWNNYQNTMTSVFQQLREDQSFVDVTLSCETGSLKAHKVVLSACSSYFQKLLLENPCKHPTIILPGDIIYNDLKTIIDFVYRGEIDVTESELQDSGIKNEKGRL